MPNYKGSDRLEKHYTPDFLKVEMNKMLCEFHREPITEFLESSAGDGALIDYLKSEYSDIPVIAYDIKNETHRKDIKECNYLKEKIGYKKGRVCFQNPPFQNGLKFVYKSLEESDYCVSILIYSRKSTKNLQFYLYQFNPYDYWIYKSTRMFKRVEYQDLLEFKYSGYTFFRKDIYNKEDIDRWIEFLQGIKGGDFLYFDKPFPPMEYMEKIKIKK